MPNVEGSTTTKFIFAIIHYTEEEIEFTCVPYNVIITTKTYFEKHGYVQDSYSTREYNDLMAICNKYNLNESQESYFECLTHSAADIKSILQNEPSFEFSQALEDFMTNLSNN